MILLTILGLTALTVVGGDLAYSQRSERRLRAWEKRVRRGKDGVRHGSEAFTVGQGRVAILMVHGFGSSPAVYSRMAPELAANGYTCRAMRLPGYGECAENFANATKEDWKSAIQSELITLRATHDSVWVVAHSKGGTLAADVLHDNPEAADGLILLAPLFRVSSKRSLGLCPRALFGVMNKVLTFSRIFENCMPPDVADPNIGHSENTDVFVPRQTYVEMFALVDDVQRKQTSIACPLMVVLARNDNVVCYRAAEAFCRRASPSAKFVYVDKSGHVIPLDYAWTDTVHEIHGFITSNGKRTQAESLARVA